MKRHCARCKTPFSYCRFRDHMADVCKKCEREIDEAGKRGNQHVWIPNLKNMNQPS